MADPSSAVRAAEGVDTVTVLLIVIAVTVAALALMGIFLARYRRVAADQALVIYGGPVASPRGYFLQQTGGRFIFPGVQRAAALDVSTRVLEMRVEGAISDVTRSVVPFNIDLVVVWRIGPGEMRLDQAARLLLGVPEAESSAIVRAVLDGGVRQVVALTPASQVSGDRERLMEAVLAVTAPALDGLGITVASIVVKEITDDHGYLEALGTKRLLEIKAEAFAAGIARMEVTTAILPGHEGLVVVDRTDGSRVYTRAVSSEELGPGAKVRMTEYLSDGLVEIRRAPREGA